MTIDYTETYRALLGKNREVQHLGLSRDFGSLNEGLR